MPTPPNPLIEAEYQKGKLYLQKVQEQVVAKKLGEKSWIESEALKAFRELKKIRKEAIEKAKRNEPFLADLQKAVRAPLKNMIDLAYVKGKEIIAKRKHSASILLQAQLGNDYEESTKWIEINNAADKARNDLKALAQATLNNINADDFDEKFEQLCRLIETQDKEMTSRLTALTSQPSQEFKHTDSSVPHRRAPDKYPTKFKEPKVEDGLENLLLQADQKLERLRQLNGERRLLPNTVDTVIEEIEIKLAAIKSSDLTMQHTSQLERIITEIDIYLIATKIKVIAQEMAKYYSDNPTKKADYLKIVEEMREERRQIKANTEAKPLDIKEQTLAMEERFKKLEAERDRIANDKYKLGVLSGSLADGYRQLANMLEGGSKEKYNKRAVELQTKWGKFLDQFLTYTNITNHLNQLEKDLSSFNLRMKAIGELQTAAKNLYEQAPEEKAQIQNQVRHFLNQDPFPTVNELSNLKQQFEGRLKNKNSGVDRSLTSSGANLFRATPSSSVPIPNARPSETPEEPDVTIRVVQGSPPK